MAHDKHGNKLHKGDVVAITAVVEGADVEEGYFNVALLPTEGRNPDGKKHLLIVNSNEVELLTKVNFGKSDPSLDVGKALSDSGILSRGRDPVEPQKKGG